MKVIVLYVGSRIFVNLPKVSFALLVAPYFFEMEGNRRKEDKHGSPSASSMDVRQDQPFSESNLRTKRAAEELGVSNVLVLGMEINGVTYQGVLLPRKECKNRKT